MLFGIAIKKSNIEADLMQIELPGSEIDLVQTRITTRSERRFVTRKSETGATCSAYNLNIMQLLKFILSWAWGDVMKTITRCIPCCHRTNPSRGQGEN